MAGLQRSSETFRRSGSSGTVWEDKHKPKPARAKEAPAARQRQSGHGGYSTSQVQPALDPPSPRVAACGFCSIFGKDKNQQPARGGRGAKGRRPRR